MSKVTFEIEGGQSVIVECNVGDNLLELARRSNVAIDAPCSGNGSCGKCRVRLVEGELESLKSRHISDPCSGNGSCGKCRVRLVEGELESLKSRHISEEEYAAGWRLSCNSKVMGDVTVFVPDIASAYQSRMKTADLSSGKEIAIFQELQQDLRQAGIPFVNRFRSLDLTMDEPTLDDTMPDNERLTWAIREPLPQSGSDHGRAYPGRYHAGQRAADLGHPQRRGR